MKKRRCLKPRNSRQRGEAPALWLIPRVVSTVSSLTRAALAWEHRVTRLPWRGRGRGLT